MEYVLFFVGLGFFLYVMFIIERYDEKRYERKLNEQREFGYKKTQRRFHRDPKQQE